MNCSCCIVKDDIRYCRTEHTYVHVPTKKQLTSVTQVIKTVYAKKSWDGVDDAVVENARERGIRVDDYIAQYIHSDAVEMPAGERQDVIDRVVIAHGLIEKHYGARQKADAQVILYSLDLGVAGTADIVIDDTELVDLKSTYSPEVDWMLQIGGYATLGGFEKAAILHVSPRFYKDMVVGGRLIQYDVELCKFYWRAAWDWWRKTKEMESDAAKRKRVSA